jgi:hypothetical protein
MYTVRLISAITINKKTTYHFSWFQASGSWSCCIVFIARRVVSVFLFSIHISCIEQNMKIANNNLYYTGWWYAMLLCPSEEDAVDFIEFVLQHLFEHSCLSTSLFDVKGSEMRSYNWNAACDLSLLTLFLPELTNGFKTHFISDAKNSGHNRN